MPVIPVTSLSDPALDVYALLSEPQLLHCMEPEEGLFIAESPLVISRALAAGYRPVSFLMEPKQMTQPFMQQILADHPEVPVYLAENDVLRNITGYAMTRGALCAMRRRPCPLVEALCGNASRIAVLEDVENPTNLGAIFRSAAALNIDALLLSPDCTDPLYRRAVRVSMGTVFQIPWTWIGKKNGCDPAAEGKRPEKSAWPADGMALLQRMGFQTAAMALREDTVSIRDPKLKEAPRLAILLGSEGYGLQEETLSLCDYTVKIPMREGVDSLNVAAASAVAFWELTGRI